MNTQTRKCDIEYENKQFMKAPGNDFKLYGEGLSFGNPNLNDVNPKSAI
jgi:hypothetical protein